MVLIAQTAFTTGLNSAASRRPQRGPFLTARCCYACRDDASDQFVVLRVIFAGDEGRRAEYYPAENPGARRNQFLLRAHYSPFLTRFHVWAFVIRVSEERGPNCPRRFAETARTRRASLPLRLNTQAGLQSQESGDENVGRPSRWPGGAMSTAGQTRVARPAARLTCWMFDAPACGAGHLGRLRSRR
jgi:hypothetical protein